MSSHGFVSLVGAGCGKLDLITLRGYQRLQTCDVVVYDDLIDTELLFVAPTTATKLYVGKRLGHHSNTQAEINQLLIDLALQGNRVVRLKGGDPFVFGRGGEEILALQEANIPFEEIPGISSAIAIPAEAGIPVTHRGKSQGLHIVTAHTAATHSTLPDKLHTLAKLDGTLIFLMGLKQLSNLVSELCLAGKSPDTPVAVLSGGNAPKQIAVRGTLATIVKNVQTAQVTAPAIILIGETASLDLTSPLLPAKPLTNVTVGITGTDLILNKLRKQLNELGATCLTVQHSIIKPLQPQIDWKRIFDSKSPCIVFTSANGVDLFFEHLFHAKIDLRKLMHCHFAVIGSGTQARLAQHGIFADFCPQIFTTEALADELLQHLPSNETIFLFRSAKGSRLLSERLAQSFFVTDVLIYDIENDTQVVSIAKPKLAQLDYLLFSSASDVRAFLENYGTIPANATCICIGAVTAKALAHTEANVIVADEISSEALIRTLVIFNSEQSSRTFKTSFNYK